MRRNSLRGLGRAIRQNARHALAEDLGKGDLTADLVPAHQVATATVVTREPCILCGHAWFEEVFRQVDERIVINWRTHDGDELPADATLCTLQGPARGMLSGERTALNFLQTLSAVATLTRRYVAAIAGTGCRILDTRKTVPGLRLAQKHAVRSGGGTNHRTGLYDAMLVKENHIIAAGSIAAAVAAGRRQHPGVLLEVEVENADELGQALAAGVDRVLLDNFTLDALRAAVAQRDQWTAAHIPLEASGNVSLETVADIARTGVDFVSVGALTKNIRAIDLSMRFSFSG